MAKTSKQAIHVRVMADTAAAEQITEEISQALEQAGYEVVEISPAYACRAPQEDQSRVYMTLVRREGK